MNPAGPTPSAMLILVILCAGLTCFAVDVARQFLRARRELIELEIALAQVTAHRDRLAEVLAHYESQLEVKDIRWVMATRGLVLLTLN